MRGQAVSQSIFGFAALALSLPFLRAQDSTRQTVPITQGRQLVGESTVEEFRNYLGLIGVGDVWRSRWVASVDLNRDKGEPYWPESFWFDIKQEMRTTDISVAVWNVYKGVFSADEMRDVNAAIKRRGVQAFALSPLGQQFCREWAMHEGEGEAQVLTLTTATIERVYERDKPAIKAARAKYIAAHPGYKD